MGMPMLSMPTTLQHLEGLSPEQWAEYLEVQERLVGGERLREFIARLVPTQPPPRHLDPLIDVIERARSERVRVCLSMPPRHAKTVTILRALAWWLQLSPADTCAYVSYNERQARSKSRIVRDVARRAGVSVVDDSSNLAEWRTPQGGGLLATGAGGGLTGQGISGLAVVDDPFKNREDADSEIIREKIYEWFGEVVYTRLEGASVLVVHTRWHEDDLIARLEADGGWEIINLSAIAESKDIFGRKLGDPLWPERFNRAELDDIRKVIGEFGFSALYQGQPRPRGAKVFGTPHYYDPATFNLQGHTISIGVDPADSEKTSADYSVAVAIAIKGSGSQRQAWILDVLRLQVTVPEFVRRLQAFRARHGNAPVGIESVAGFKAVPQMMREIDKGLSIIEINPHGDKFQRAQGFAAAWNGGRVYVPTGAPWLSDYLSELGRFTGVKDSEDDQVDGTAHAWNRPDPVTYQRPKGAIAPRRL